MTFCRTLMLMLASCLIVGCAAQDRHTPPAGSATSTAPTPAPSSTPSPPPGLTPAPDQEPDRILPDGSVAPKTGEYIYVEELPEAITRVRPNYPGEARRKGIEGTVMLQCLVLRDGAVGDVRIVKSVPGLDEAAVTCLGQWRFKPAMAKGQPVTVWVGVPINFSLH